MFSNVRSVFFLCCGLRPSQVSAAVSSSTAACFKSSGLSFVIPRGFKSTGSVDTAVCTTLNNAKSAGIATRDV
jgi:hypothetical protein